MTCLAWTSISSRPIAIHDFKRRGLQVRLTFFFPIPSFHAFSPAVVNLPPRDPHHPSLIAPPRTLTPNEGVLHNKTRTKRLTICYTYFAHT